MSATMVVSETKALPTVACSVFEPRRHPQTESRPPPFHHQLAPDHHSLAWLYLPRARFSTSYRLGVRLVRNYSLLTV